MTTDDTPARTAGDARVMLDAILALPREAAGMNSQQIRAIIAQLGATPVMPDQFGELTQEARTAVSTVASALMSMREHAIERERSRRP